MPLNLQDLLHEMIKRDASDLHITAYTPPQFRIDERLVPTENPPLTPDDTKRLCYSMLNEEQIKRFESEKELDLSFGIEGLSRFRVNVFVQRGCAGGAIRAIPFNIMSFEECGLPVKVVSNICKLPKGLILVTGATGSGKSTTLASMIDSINSQRHCHIVTIEDPIEYVHKNKKAIVDQREVNSDTHSFAQALKHVLRQDPDVILIGEMRDLETIEAALVIAETGHLVFATLHTSDCVQTINRVIDVFPSHQQQQVRTQLSFVLMGVLSQQLIPKIGKGRVLALEVLMVNPAVRSLVRESKVHQIYSVIQTSQKESMKTMNQSLYELYINKTITLDEATGRSTNVEDLERLLRR
ncbi:MAG: type IV pilus twitching motility protein PilT [Candidatus Omnitrophica bacterium]|nr:type IV pilus twitching motility protein PilT [Candidatus Omnitrophota bacterium]